MLSLAASSLNFSEKPGGRSLFCFICSSMALITCSPSSLAPVSSSSWRTFASFRAESSAIAPAVTFASVTIVPQLAHAEVSDGSCSPGYNLAAAGGQHDGLGDLIGGLDWGRIGRNAWAFTKGAAIGFVTGLAVTAGVALA